MSVLMKNEQMIAGLVPSEESVSVTADGVKTYAQLFDALYALIDGSKINHTSVLKAGISGNIYIYHLVFYTSSRYIFSYVTETGETSVRSYDVTNGSKYYLSTHSSSIAHYDNSSQIPASGSTFTLYY